MTTSKKDITTAKKHIKRMVKKNKISERNGYYILDFDEELRAKGFSINRIKNTFLWCVKLPEIYDFIQGALAVSELLIKESIF